MTKVNLLRYFQLVVPFGYEWLFFQKKKSINITSYTIYNEIVELYLLQERLFSLPSLGNLHGFYHSTSIYLIGI